MHIVYISREYPPSLRGGGISSYLRIVAEGFSARGHKVTVIAANDDTTSSSDEIVNGVRVIRLSGGDFYIKNAEPKGNLFCKFRFLYRFRSYRCKIRKMIETLKDIDIIEVAEFGAEGLFLNDLKTPVVYRLHTPALMNHDNFSLQHVNLSNILYYHGGLKELSILRNHAKYITSCSTSLKEWAVRYARVHRKDIKVIYNPISPKFYDNAASNGIVKTDEPTVFFAGTICDWKGAEDLITACKILNDTGPKVRLRMAGKIGAYGENLRNKYRDCRWLEILGKVSQEELKELYATASVVCFPSWWENMPMVCIEAMTMGAIVIGSNSGGMSEIIEDDESGFLLPPKNPKLWADKISSILSMCEKDRSRISANATKRIKEIFSLDKILDDTESYFKDVIKDCKQ